MTSFSRFALAGLATVLLVGSAEAMPVASATAPATPVVKTAVIVTKVVRPRRVVRVVRPRRAVIVKKVIR